MGANTSCWALHLTSLLATPSGKQHMQFSILFKSRKIESYFVWWATPAPTQTDISIRKANSARQVNGLVPL